MSVSRILFKYVLAMALRRSTNSTSRIDGEAVTTRSSWPVPRIGGKAKRDQPRDSRLEGNCLATGCVLWKEETYGVDASWEEMLGLEQLT